MEQRAGLAARANGRRPHMLMMSATPIPRTVAMCKHGDMALTCIDEKPKGRQPVLTKVLREGETGEAYGRDAQPALIGRQVRYGAQFSQVANYHHVDFGRRTFPTGASLAKCCEEKTGVNLQKLGAPTGRCHA